MHIVRYCISATNSILTARLNAFFRLTPLATSPWFAKRTALLSPQAPIADFASSSVPNVRYGATGISVTPAHPIT